MLRHYRKIAGDDAPQPSVLLLQAPIFHGHAMAVFLEMDSAADAAELSSAGRRSRCDSGRGRRCAQQREFGGAGGHSGSVKMDPTEPNGGLVVGGGGQLAHSAVTAVECAESMTAARPTGKIQ